MSACAAAPEGSMDVGDIAAAWLQRTPRERRLWCAIHAISVTAYRVSDRDERVTDLLALRDLVDACIRNVLAEPLGDGDD